MRNLSVVIPSFNSEGLLKKNLPSLISQIDIEKDEVIIVDDNSQDDTVRFIKAYYPFIKIIENKKKMTFSHNCNAGVAQARHDLVCLLNTDVEIMKGALELLVRHFEDKDTFVVCPLELSEAGSKPSYAVLSGAEFKFGIFRFRYKEIPPDREEAIPILFAHGACTVYDRTKFMALGGYDTVYKPLYWEDMDICWRAWRKGWKSLCEPRSRIVHECKGTVGKSYTIAQIKTFHWKNRFLFTWKEIISPPTAVVHLLFVLPALFVMPLIGRGEFTFGFLGALKQLPELLGSRIRDKTKDPVLSTRDVFTRFPYKEESDICTRPESHNTQFKEAMARYDFIKDLVKGRKVLDAGCGFGYGADYLSGWAKEVVGVDSNNEAIEWARSHYRRGNVSFVLSDLKELKIPAGYFDAVCLFEAIHQVKDHEILLKELWRVLKEGGLLIISTRRRRSETVTPHPLHVHEFKASELEALLKKSGFSDVRLYGMERPAEAYKLEAELEKVRRLDPMGIKKIIPRKAVSALVYLISKAKGITPPQELDYGSFGISKETIDTAPGILAVSAKSSAAQVKESGRP